MSVKNYILFSPNFNIYFGCSKEPSHCDGSFKSPPSSTKKIPYRNRNIAAILPETVAAILRQYIAIRLVFQ